MEWDTEGFGFYPAHWQSQLLGMKGENRDSPPSNPHRAESIPVDRELVEVLIVGAGPTGLMLACQLLRFGISFRIIDKQPDRSQESRAFGIQAKTMEIFQNLGIVDQFLEQSVSVPSMYFYINGRRQIKMNLNQIKLKDTPFPGIFFLPQSETERILIAELAKKEITIERQKELETFISNPESINAVVRDLMTGEQENIRCLFLAGCDGAHSIVRRTLAIPFVGAPYNQDFFLADVKMRWPKSIETGLMLFLDSKKGFLFHAPFSKDFHRLIAAPMSPIIKKEAINVPEIQDYVRNVTHQNVNITEAKWMSRFHLHHRVVNQYQHDRAFLVGDAAHIHSPVGAQGMNTGLQDATNLAWKLAITLRKQLSDELLKTYTLEREFIGRKLTQTTDRFFVWLTSPKKIIKFFRPLVLILLLRLIAGSKKIQERLFWLMSELGIYYPKNKFLVGKRAGRRAPDARLNNTSLFMLLKEHPFNALIFLESEKENALVNANQILELEQKHPDWLIFHKIILNKNTEVLFARYNISKSGICVIRPDGYIGFYSTKLEFTELFEYLQKFFLK